MSSNETSLEKLHKGHVGAQVIFACYFSQSFGVLKETFGCHFSKLQLFFYSSSGQPMLGVRFSTKTLSARSLSR